MHVWLLALVVTTVAEPAHQQLFRRLKDVALQWRQIFGAQAPRLLKQRQDRKSGLPGQRRTDFASIEMGSSFVMID
jgi:hypothetical protein